MRLPPELPPNVTEKDWRALKALCDSQVNNSLQENILHPSPLLANRARAVALHIESCACRASSQEGLPLGGKFFQKLDLARQFARSNPQALVLAFDWFTMPYKDQHTHQWKHLPVVGKDKQLQPVVIKRFVVFRTVVRVALCAADSVPRRFWRKELPLSCRGLRIRPSRPHSRTGSATRRASSRSSAASTRFCRRGSPTGTGWCEKGPCIQSDSQPSQAPATQRPQSPAARTSLTPLTPHPQDCDLHVPDDLVQGSPSALVDSVSRVRALSSSLPFLQPARPLIHAACDRGPRVTRGASLVTQLSSRGGERFFASFPHFVD